MKILVTGALGHIGSKLIRQLPQNYHEAEFILIDNLSTQRYASLFKLPPDTNYHFIEDDILTMELDDIIAEASVVIHLAAITDAANSFNNPDQLHHNNFESTRKIAELCCKYKTKLLFPSSTSVYGSQANIVDEDCASSELKPQSPYAECKINEENLLTKLHQEHNLQVAICRFGTIFGTSPGMRFHTAVNKFCWQATLGKPLTIWETAYKQKRPYLDLTDAINAIGFFIKQNLFTGETYNVVTSNHTVCEVFEHIKNLIPTVSLSFVNNKIMNQLSYEVTNTKLTNKGFNFTGNLGNGIKQTIELLQNMKSKNI